MFGGYEKIIQIKELNMLLQSKMIEEWSRENAMIKVLVLCYIHFFQESIAGLNPIDEVHCMSIEGEVARSTHKLRVHIRSIYRFPFIRLSGSWLPTQ